MSHLPVIRPSAKRVHRYIHSAQFWPILFSKYKHVPKKTKCWTKFNWSDIWLFRETQMFKITCTRHWRFPFTLWCFIVRKQQSSKSWRNQFNLITNQSDQCKKWGLRLNGTADISFLKIFSQTVTVRYRKYNQRKSCWRFFKTFGSLSIIKCVP